ncbi:MAG: nucleoside-triphosphatase [Thermotogota bacterium]
MPLLRLAITGNRGSGKTTFFQAMVNEIKRTHTIFFGFKTYFVESGTLWLEWINAEHDRIQLGKKSGKYSMKPFFENIEHLGEILLQQNMTSRVFVADEIGFLEQLSKTMQKGVIKAISDAPFSFFTMKKVDYPLINRLKNFERMRIIDLDKYDWHEKNEMLQGCLKMIQRII